MKSIHDPRYIKMIGRLRDIRKEKKVSQYTLAERLNIPQENVSKVENFVRRLDLIELCDWLDGLDYDLIDFLRETGRVE